MATGAAALDLNPTFGAMFIGVILGAAFFGVSCVQAWFYFTKYTNDAWYMKVLVAAVFCTDMLHQILISHTMYLYTIANYANPLYLVHIVWSLVVQVLISAITAFLVQGFFVYRIYKLSGGNLWYTGGVSMFSLGAFVINIVYTVHAFHIPDLTHISDLRIESQLINILGAVSDVAIAAAMVMLLKNSRTGFKSSDNMINRMMLFVVNTGLLTSICALSSLISILASPNSFIYICFFFTLGRLYANSLFASLNARESMRATLNSSGADEISLSFEGNGSRGRFRHGLSSGSRARGGATSGGAVLSGLHSSRRDPKQTEISINIQQTTELTRDDEVARDVESLKELPVKHNY